MSDYKKLGLKCGLEFHQELDCGKLFCSCSSAFREEGLETEIKRKLRPVAGEMGAIDAAAQFEFLRDREFLYHGYSGEHCLVEADEEPPHSMNREALKSALTIALMLKMTVPREVHVMRKTVTDGSAVSGFQRTMLVGVQNSKSVMETSLGPVSVENLSLEEDACKIEERKGNAVHYSLSRLGIPLIEIGTGPDIKSPEHALEVAKKVGSLFRALPNVKRGIGTIRQDVNVSIAGGARVEVKGWQDLNTLPKLVENEALRQKSLLEIREDLAGRKLREIKSRPEKVTGMFRSTESRIVRALVDGGAEVYALVLPKFGGLLKREVCPGKTFGKELAEYAKAYGTKGMIHSDEDLKKYVLEKEFSALRTKLGAGEEDLVLIIAEKEDVALKAVNAVLERAKHCLIGIPKEVRTPNHEDATNGYARPMPGADRMYPETDIQAMVLTKEILDEVRKSMPETLEEKKARFEKMGLNSELASQMIRSDYLSLFDSLVKEFKKVEARTIANLFLNTIPDLKKRESLDVSKLSDECLTGLVSLLNEKKIITEALSEIIKLAAETGKSPSAIVKEKGFSTISEAEARKKVKALVSEHGRNFGLVMGKAMAELKGRFDGRKIAEIVRKECG